MEYTALEDLFWEMTTLILGEGFPPEKIRLTYPKDGQPGWTVNEDIVFIRFLEQEDEYARQLDSVFEAERGTVIKKTARTRVWEMQLNAYGPRACETVNRIKDGVFRQDIKRLLARSGVFLIPDLPVCRRAPELFAGQWWNRWDISLHFNELYRLPDEDVGRIESVSIKANYNR